MPNENNKKIFMYIYSLHIGGGAENVMFKVASYLHTKGFEIVVCGMCDEQPSFEERYRAQHIKVINLKANPNNIFDMITKLIPVLKVERPDCVLNWLYPCIISGGIAAKLTGVKHIVSNLRGPDLKKKKIKVLVDRLVSKLYTGHIAVCASVAAVFQERERYDRKKMTVIPNGIDPQELQKQKLRSVDEVRKELGITEKHWVVGSVGRLYSEKNQELQIRAWPGVVRVVSNARLVLIGDGPARQSLEQLAHSLGVRDLVVFAGWQRNVYEYLQACNVYVLSSKYEGHPGSILQAWLMKLPVVATKVSGTKDVVIDGKNGLLFSKNNPEELTKILINLHQFPEESETYAASGYADVLNKHTEEKMLKAYENYLG